MTPVCVAEICHPAIGLLWCSNPPRPLWIWHVVYPLYRPYSVPVSVVVMRCSSVHQSCRLPCRGATVATTSRQISALLQVHQSGWCHDGSSTVPCQHGGAGRLKFPTVRMEGARRRVLAKFSAAITEGRKERPAFLAPAPVCYPSKKERPFYGNGRNA